MAKQRIVILGGGLSGLVTAYNLSAPEQRDRYDITIYQQGWRLGGKCATGRNADEGDRIQEHGLHVFMGQYDNAFHMVQNLYKEVDTFPIKTWEDAFTQQASVSLMEKVKDDWIPWQLDAPVFPGTPGVGKPPTIWERMFEMLDWVLHQMFHVHGDVFRQSGGHVPKKNPSFFERIIRDILSAIGFLSLNAGLALIKLAQKVIKDLDPDPSKHSHDDHNHLASILHKLRDWAYKQVQEILDDNNDVRRLWIMFDLMISNAIGGLRDGLLFNPDAHLDQVNKLDYKEWLRSHNCSEVAVESAIIRGVYDLVFAYKRGDWKSDGDTEAGTMFLSLMNTSLYRGSIIWKFNTATGEMVIAPLYEALKARGVKIEFFSRVDELIPSDTGNWIGEVKIGRQVNLKNGSYEPLRTLPSGQRVWPDRPLYDQIKDSAKLKKDKIDLESFWTPWKDKGKPLHLKMGEDYDWVVLAIPPAAHPTICKRLMDQYPAWDAMVNKVETTATQNLQTWMPKTVKDMGWDLSTLVGAYDATGLNTWSDISEVLPTENWPATSSIVSEQIACGPLPCAQFPPPKSERDFPERSLAEVTASANAFLDDDCWRFWTNDFSKGRAGPINSIYHRANVDPSERYTLTVKDSTRFRMKTNESGYNNLFLTGDWILNGQNQGSFEATTISGKLASKAISGFPETIFRIDADKLIAKTPLPSQPAVKPKFVNHEGVVTFPGQIKFTDTTMWAFFMKADRSKLEEFCRKTFTVPSGGAVQVLPLSSHIMATIVDIKHGVYVDVPDRGWSPERELAFWIPVVRVEEEHGKLVAKHFNMVMPYLALNNPGAISAGREIFGYWKQRGWLTIPGDPGNTDNGFVVDLFASKTLEPTTEEQRNRWVTFTHKGQRPSEAMKKVKTFGDGIKALHAHIAPEIEKWHPGLGFTIETLGELMTGHIPQLFLKQFRDISDGNDACYQAITEAMAHVTAFKSFPHFDEYAMEINSLASSPVAEQFGIDPNQNVLSASIELEMVVNPGKTLWQA